MTVTAGGGHQEVRPFSAPVRPAALALLTVAVLVLVVLALLEAFAPSPPWPLGVLLGPSAFAAAAAASATVAEADHPARRAERLLRGILAAAVSVLLVALSGDFTATASCFVAAALAVIVYPAMAVRVGFANRKDPSVGQPRAEVVPQLPTGHGSVSEPLPPLCRSLKRFVDVIVASVVLVLAVPVLAVSAVAIMVEGRGGVLFRHTRVGLDGRPFRMYKLRTMRPANDDGEHRAYVADLIRGHGRPQGGIYKLVVDDRRTTVGRVLRAFSIDELPQLWNVLRGDMSLVGPRPPLPAEVALYDEATSARLAAKPGLTGLWQVSGRSRLSFQEMVELDLRYRQEWSPLLDLRILLRTPKAVLWGRETA